MKVTYDASVDAAYIYLEDPVGVGKVRTVPIDPREVNGEINLDFDGDGRLVGIEVLDASRLLPPEVLRLASSG